MVLLKSDKDIFHYCENNEAKNLFLSMIKYLRLIVCIFCSVFFLSCSVSPEAKKETLEVALRKFNEAFRKGNTSFLEQMITEDYQHSNGSDHPINKEVWVNYLKKREKQLTSGELKILRYTMDQIDMQMNNDSARVAGRIQVRSQRNDSIRNQEYQVTHLWILEKGSWKRAQFQDTKIY